MAPRRDAIVGLMLAAGCSAAQGDYQALVARAEAGVRRGELAQAERAFSEAHAVDPEGIEARYGLAFVNSQRCVSERRACQACLEGFDAILAEQSYRDTRYNRARCAFKLGKKDEALADLNRAVKSRPNDLDYRMTRALMLRHMRRHEEACADLEKARTLGADVEGLLAQGCRK